MDETNINLIYAREKKQLACKKIGEILNAFMCDTHAAVEAVEIKTIDKNKKSYIIAVDIISGYDL